ncbi:MAG: hypothetical protein ABW003_10455 [Microvirga sp.]|jgi:hypothetical protein
MAAKSEAWNEESREKDGLKKGPGKGHEGLRLEHQECTGQKTCGREGFEIQEERLALAFASRPNDAASRFDSDATRRLVDLKRL